METLQDSMITKSYLKESGWSDKLISDLLEPPDMTKKNRRGKHPMRLYKEQRVKEVEEANNLKEILKQRLRNQGTRKLEKLKREQYMFDNFKIHTKSDAVFLMGEEDKARCDRFDLNQNECEEIITRMLRESSWYPLKRLLHDYKRSYPESYQSEEKIDKIKKSLLAQGWNGRPLIYWADDGKKLRSGNHRYHALKELLEDGLISPDFLVPVLYIFQEWQWMSDFIPQKILEEIDYTLHYYTLKHISMYCAIWYFCTGIDDF